MPNDNLKGHIEAMHELRRRRRVVRYLFSDDKRQRILAARQQWPQLPGSAIAMIAGASPSYVSEVLNEMEPEGLST